MIRELPEWLEPMAATLTRERDFVWDRAGVGAARRRDDDDGEWIFERKLDGIRLLAFKDARGVRLLSRNKLLRNASYPAIADAIAALPVRDAILDGEALGNGWENRGVPNGFHLFDALWLDGVDITARGLDARRELLRALPLRPPLFLVERLDEERPWERACAEGWEGVIAKRRDAPYEHRRSRAWLKLKCEAGQELVIGGFTDPRGQRVAIGALLVGYFEGDEFVFAGKVGTGLDEKLLRSLRERMDALALSAAPFTQGTGLPRANVHWVRPELVIEVAFMEWTGSGKLRHPRLVRLRDDKPAREVTRERA